MYARQASITSFSSNGISSVNASSPSCGKSVFTVNDANASTSFICFLNSSELATRSFTTASALGASVLVAGS